MICYLYSYLHAMCCYIHISFIINYAHQALESHACAARWRSGRLNSQWSSDKKTGWLGYNRDDITQLYMGSQ